MDNGQDKNSAKIITKKITVLGIVQGIGFRPTIYRMAVKHGVFGTVRNLGGQAEIIVQSMKENIDNFLNELRFNNNKDYEIVNIKIEDIDKERLEDFQIISSGDNREIAIIPPDLPTCPTCAEELYNKDNRRYKNPFISCMVCGPRYTIIEKLPYDRENTTMVDFHMCPECLHEYTFPESRRFDAQTISCNHCGPYLILNDLKEEDAFEEAVKIIKNGGIIAVKGVGGYHFACSPFIEETVLNLRKLKGREEKPFAVMFESLDSIKEYCIVSEKEKEVLSSKARPIVLLKVTDKNMAYSTGKGSLYCGAFLPYTPLQIMLLKRCGPLIMTSANISNRPIIKDDEEMISLKSPYLNGVLYNTRRIVRSVDDSVVKVIDNGVGQMIRRSRGYVPYPIFLKGYKDKQIFAAGGDLKAAFCLYKKGNAVVSQYFGDLEESTVLDRYKHSVEDLLSMLKMVPNMAVCDMHPNYFSSRFANSLNIPVLQVQHHHAHIASVMAERDLREKVIGVAFDGTGYGTDGNIWGGEFLVCEGAGFERAAHLSYTPLLGGDSSMKDAKKTAACFLINGGLEEYIKDERSAVIKAALKNNINTVLSSSMGRLFDAASSILGIGDENTYEGECAINLEKKAALAIKNNTVPIELSFELIYKDDGTINIDAAPLLKEMCRLKCHENIEALSLGFHYAASDMVLKVCKIIREKQNINTVALSGGVFQNTVLIERVINILREEKFKVYYNMEVPPNDGGISLGQTFVALMR